MVSLRGLAVLRTAPNIPNGPNGQGRVMPVKRRDLEHPEQVKFVDWFRLQFPGVLIYAIPNGGNRNVITARKLKAEGVLAGMPDLHIPDWDLWIEMKAKNQGSLSVAQKERHAELRAIGHTVITCHGFVRARDATLAHIHSLNTKPT